MWSTSQKRFLPPLILYVKRLLFHKCYFKPNKAIFFSFFDELNKQPSLGFIQATQLKNQNVLGLPYLFICQFLPHHSWVTQLYTWGKSQPYHIHSSSKVTVWCDFQPALPPLLAPASSPRGPSFTPNLGRRNMVGVKVEGGGLMSADTRVPSLWDNQASGSKLFSVCTAGLGKHHFRADLCPNFHMFSI